MIRGESQRWPRLLPLTALVLLLIVPVCAQSAAGSQPVAPAADTLTIASASGRIQENRAVSIARPFREGEIRDYPRATIGGTALLTQADVKNRWPDGSVKFAIVSFVIPKLPTRPLTIVLDNQATCYCVASGNPGATKDQLLAEYDFDGTLELSGQTSHVISARAMLESSKFRYWLSGPIVTALILEDRTPSRSYDVNTDGGTGNPLHPIFEAWFYAAARNVELGYTLEDAWASSTLADSMRDETYRLTIKTGRAAPITRFSFGPFKQIGRSVVHKTFWVGNEPPPIRINYNSAYLFSTRAFPHWDTGIKMAASKMASDYEHWKNLPAARKSITGGPDKNGVDGIGVIEKDIDAGGGNPWIGLSQEYQVMYLMIFDPRMKEIFDAMGDLEGRLPFHFREADNHAGTGRWFDQPGSGRVPTFGRVVSINARQTFTMAANFNVNCGGPSAADLINVPKLELDGWGAAEGDHSHWPSMGYYQYLLTGKYYFLEQTQYTAAYALGARIGCMSENYGRHGSDGFLLEGRSERGEAWAFRDLLYGAFISPNVDPAHPASFWNPGQPVIPWAAEAYYFDDKMKNNISWMEGQHDITPLSYPAKVEQWRWGHDRSTNSVADGTAGGPLHVWLNPGFLAGSGGEPCKIDHSVECGRTFMVAMLTTALGMARQMGYKTDALLKYIAPLFFHFTLDPAVTSVSQYMPEVYSYAIAYSATHQYFKNWAEHMRGYQPYNGTSSGLFRSWRDESAGAGHQSYGFEFQSAISFLSDFTVDGYKGTDAWAWMKAHKPYQDKFSIGSPELSITPFPTYNPAAAPAAAAQPSSPRQTTEVDSSPATAAKHDPNPAPAAASRATSKTGQLDMRVGWHELPNTSLDRVCPPEGYGSAQGETYDFHAACLYGGPIAAWNSAVADTDHNFLIVWGGGHNDYYGNEIYVLDLNGTPTMRRVNNPTLPSNFATRNCGCPDGLPVTGSCPKPVYGNRAPNSRHTYNQLVYLPGRDEMLAAGGVPACANPGGMPPQSDTWALNTTDWTWSVLNHGTGINPGWPSGGVSAWDPARQMVLFENGNDLLEFNPANNQWIARTGRESAQIDGHMTGEVDPVDELFFLIGAYAYNPAAGGIRVFDISNRTKWQMQSNWKQSGCDHIVGNLFPGVAWDSSQNKLVMWAQDGTTGSNGPYAGTGNTVYIGSVDKKSRTLTCTSKTFPDGPPSAPKNNASNGTLGRWRYFPKTAERPDLGIFVAVVGAHDNAYYLRLN